MALSIISGLNSVNHRKWKELVINHPDGNAFQTPEIALVLNATIGYTLLVLAAVEDDLYVGILVAVLQKEFHWPMGYFSARTVVWGGPLVDTAVSDPTLVSHTLIQELVKSCKNRSVYIEFRNLFNITSIAGIFDSLGFQYKEAINFHVRTSTYLEAKPSISSSKLRQVRKSMAAGAEIIVAKNKSEVLEFYAILENLYSNRVKKPLPHISFFTGFLTSSMNSGCGIFLLIRYKGRIVGGIMCPVFNNKVMYEWYIGGLDQEYREIHPSVLATYAAINYAGTNNYTYFDFMGAGRPDVDYGVREFKSKFGGDQVNYGRFIKIFNKPLYSLAASALKLKKKYL